MIDVLVGAGANEIGGINFTVTQASKHLDEAREKAIADARRKAEIYAKAAGVTLGEPISISEETGSPGRLFRSKMAAPMAAGAPVAQGEETLSVTVSVSWAIKASAVTFLVVPRMQRTSSAGAGTHGRCSKMSSGSAAHRDGAALRPAHDGTTS